MNKRSARRRRGDSVKRKNVLSQLSKSENGESEKRPNEWREQRKLGLSRRRRTS